MRAFAFILALSCACLVAGAPAVSAQEGHPLKGSWIGTWSGNKALGEDIVVVLSWDGKTISGTINPGVDNMAIKNATLNPDGWVVHLEADAKDKSGKVTTYIIDGKIENLPFHNRTVTGTWRSPTEKGAFKIGRQ